MNAEPPETPSKPGAATGAAWSDAEKVAYMLVVAEHALDAAIESKVSTAPIPHGRNVNACRKILKKFKDKHQPMMEAIKAGVPIEVANEDKDRPKATPKRKAKGEAGSASGGAGEGTPRKKKGAKSEAVVKEEEDGEAGGEEAV